MHPSGSTPAPHTQFVLLKWPYPCFSFIAKAFHTWFVAFEIWKQENPTLCIYQLALPDPPVDRASFEIEWLKSFAYSKSICSKAVYNWWLCTYWSCDNSIGSLFFIQIFNRLLVAMITYFIAGALVMKFHYQATGSDIVPNKAFWVQFPFLIKVYTLYLLTHSCLWSMQVLLHCICCSFHWQDGFVFTFGPCFRCISEKARGKNDYQRI